METGRSVNNQDFLMHQAEEELNILRDRLEEMDHKLAEYELTIAEH